MKSLFIEFLLISLLFSFDIDDWTYFRKIGTIHSIIEDDELVHFVSSNGIYSYNDIEEDYYYNFTLSNQIDFNSSIDHFYFDSNTGMYWLINQYGIKMKHSFHDFWSEVSYRRFNIIDTSEIINIGSSSSYIWIKLYDRIIALDQITGLVIEQDIDYNEIDNIDWNTESDVYNQNINIDLSNYAIFDKWDIRYNKIVNNRGDVLYPTAFKEDKSGNVWVGTDKGIILKGSSYSHRLEVIDFGLKFRHVTATIVDDNMDWWFGDSQFLRTGIKKHQQNFRKNSYPFLAKWNEYRNEWKYYESSMSMLIRNIDINDIVSIDNVIYLATMDGLLIFDELNGDWMKVDDELYDQAVWDLEYYDGSIYLATARGYDEFAIISNKIINSDNVLSKMLRNSEIYDILVVNDAIYIASERGLFEQNIDSNSYTLISDRKFKNIRLYQHYIYANDHDLWRIDMISLKSENLKKDVLNFSISGDLVWTNHFDHCKLLNINTNNSWTFNDRNGLPSSNIYRVESDESRVWFMTDNGIAIYNWDVSDYE